jgi:hypothetical protein
MRPMIHCINIVRFLRSKKGSKKRTARSMSGGLERLQSQ